MMMHFWKKNIVAAMLLCGAISSFAQNWQGEAGKWTFVGQLKNPEGTLIMMPVNNIHEQHTVLKKNGMFKFTTKLTEAEEYMILSPAACRNEPGFSIVVNAVPGEVLTAKGFCNNDKPADGLTFGGTDFYKYYTEAYKIQDKVQETEDAQSAINFVKAHPGNEIAAVFVGAVGCYDPDRLNELLNLMPPAIRNGRMKQFINQEIEDAKEYVQQKERDEMLPEGSMAPEFTLEGLNGQPFSLSSLRGKYVILDFWGSWCGWCISGFPDMKTYYYKYKNKMEILGMDCGDTKAKWKRAVDEHELPWKQVFVPKGSQVFDDYRISAYPTKVILGPDGKVLKTVIGEDPKFYDYLDKLLK